MKAVWLENQKLALREIEMPRPPAGEALVRVRSAGICNTDLELVQGYYPFAGVLGHEFVGTVEQGPANLVGKRVVGEINAVCGVCATCRAGRPTHCEERTVLGIVARDGAFAEWLMLPAENLHLVPDSVSDEQAVFTEPLAAAFEILEQIEVSNGDRVLVVGDGKLGQLIARVLVGTGCDPWLSGHHPERAPLLEKAGVNCVLSHAELPGGFDIAIECTGNPGGFDVAVAQVRPRGSLVLKSTYAGNLTLDIAQVVVNEITLVGSRCGPFLPALAALESQRVVVDNLIEARYPLGSALEAIDHAARPGALKILLDISG